MGSQALGRIPGHRIGLLVVFVLLVMTAGLVFARVEALPTDVSLSPSAGTVGTTVTVTGSACSPGLIVNPSQARLIGVTLGVNVDVAVPAGGAWSIQFVVPTNAIEGPHVIAAACVRDLVPVPYVPLTFTVTAPPASSTTLVPSTTVATTVTSTVSPTTTAGSGLGGPTTTTTALGLGATTTTIDVAADPSGSGTLTGDGRSPDSEPASDPVTTAQLPASNKAATPTSIDYDTPLEVEPVAAARIERGGRQPLGFAPLTPIGDGWVGLLVSGLLAVLIMSAGLAVAWFAWLRHSDAREWWRRWMHQLTHIRSHPRPR